MGQDGQAGGLVDAIDRLLTRDSPFWNIGRLATPNVLVKRALHGLALFKAQEFARDVHASHGSASLRLDSSPVNVDPQSIQTLDDAIRPGISTRPKTFEDGLQLRVVRIDSHPDDVDLGPAAARANLDRAKESQSMVFGRFLGLGDA